MTGKGHYVSKSFSQSLFRKPLSDVASANVQALLNVAVPDVDLSAYDQEKLREEINTTVADLFDRILPESPKRDTHIQSICDDLWKEFSA